MSPWFPAVQDKTKELSGSLDSINTVNYFSNFRKNKCSESKSYISLIFGLMPNLMSRCTVHTVLPEGEEVYKTLIVMKENIKT